MATYADLLEPGAKAFHSGNSVEVQENSRFVDNCANLSLAISAKRQADALERIAAALEYSPHGYNLFDAIANKG